MKPITINIIPKFAIGALLLLFITVNLHPALVINGAGGLYGDDGREVAVSGETIENLTAIGAGYFLNSYSDILILLNRVELSDVNGANYDEMIILADRALLNIENAKKVYLEMVKIAEITPYNELAVSKLKGFDYNGYMIENNLHVLIFKEVEGYLSRGDVTGMLKANYMKVSSISAMVRSIKEEISMNRSPEIPILWKLNRKFSDTLLFGQYAAEVFQNAID